MSKEIIKVVRWKCSLCGEEYEEPEDAAECFLQGFNPSVQVGDIVVARAGFGWFDGDERWISNPKAREARNPEHGNCFANCCTYQFYYVVTVIDQDAHDGHRAQYHLFTRAMSGKQGYAGGWTYDEDHWKPVKVMNPPKAVVESSKELIGRKATYLL